MVWDIFANQIYLYRITPTFEVDTNHKTLMALVSVYSTTAPLRTGRMGVRLQVFNYHLNYIPGKEELGNNEADYHSRHPTDCEREPGQHKSSGI